MQYIRLLGLSKENIGLAKKFVQVFPQDVTENPDELFSQPNTTDWVA